MYVGTTSINIVVVSDFRVDGLPRDVGAQVGVVVAPGGRHLAADAAHVGLFPRVHLEVIREVVAPGESLATVRALVVPGARVLGHVALPVGLVGELEAALVADERLHPAVGAHVGVQQGLTKVSLKKTRVA